MTKEAMKAALKEIGAKQWELAQEIGVHEKTLIYWFHCEACTPERAARIEAALQRMKSTRSA